MPDASGGATDAKALRGAAQKVLAVEIEARAKRLAEAADDAFVLSNDGAVRWLGEPVARLVAAENLLEPRLRLLADEQLTGPAREAVDARLAQWLKSHTEKLLGPLLAVSKAEDIVGISRGVAFQLAEALGVLERQKVADEVKGLDQETRAVLRKYGVRFGAYHIYMPGLLKPAPRTLGLLLFALKHGGLSQKGLDDLPALASSGRTSIAVDPEVAKPLYRIVGYRVCGPRAVRVDILERLADLIRPPLSWRPGMPGDKPAGAIDGRGFTITVAMTSLVGCSGEDFAAILRALGYRVERRPAPPPEAVTPSPAPATAVEAALMGPTDSEPATLAPVEPSPVPEAAAERAPQPVPEATTQPEQVPVAAAAEAAPSEPAMIEIWRPGRPEGARRPRRKPEERRAQPDRPAPAAASAPAEGAPKEGEPRPEARRPRQDERPRREERPRRDDSPPGATNVPATSARTARAASVSATTGNASCHASARNGWRIRIRRSRRSQR